MSIKRVLDVILSLFLIILLSPLFLLIPMFIGVTSRGPIIFTQERVGYCGAPFVIYKFRTLFHNPSNPHRGVVYEGDPSVTRVGRVLRSVHLDELPQLWNILYGDMSFIGPRPVSVDVNEKISESIPDYKKRYVVKPGLTGLAQIKIKFDKTLESRLLAFRYDCQYIKNRSFFLDLSILIRTIPVVIARRGV